MTEEMFKKLLESLQGTEYEEAILDPDFKEFTKFFKIKDVESGDILYTGWYCGYLNITIDEGGNVFVANYLEGKAETF